MRKRIIAAVVFAFVTGLALGAASLAVAQPSHRIFTKPSAKQAVPAQSQAPLVSEAPLSIRITGMHHGRAVGTLMAKVDGKWVEVQLAPQDSLLRSQ